MQTANAVQEKNKTEQKKNRHNNKIVRKKEPEVGVRRLHVRMRRVQAKPASSEDDHDHLL